MLRKVETTDTLTIPFSVIETHDDGIIIEVPEYMTINSTVIEEQENENGELIEVEVEISNIIEINPEDYGSPASWADVKNPLYFDLKIDNSLYSWDGKEGTRKIALTENGVIGLVRYIPFKVNSKTLHTKKVIAPAFIPLVVRNGVLSVDGNKYKTAVFANALNGNSLTLGDIQLIHGDTVKFAGIEYKESLQSEE